MNNLRPRRAIGQDLDTRMTGLDQVGRIIAITTDYADVDRGVLSNLDHVENMQALLAGAASLLRATAETMSGTVRELLEADQ